MPSFFAPTALLAATLLAWPFAPAARRPAEWPLTDGLATEIVVSGLRSPVFVTAPPGDYTVHVSAPDIYPTTATDPRFSVRFANANQGAQAWNDATGRFATGTSITVQ